VCPVFLMHNSRMGILFGLLTALSWGGADFLARFATHRIGTLRTMLYMQATGFVLLTIFLPQLGGWGHLADGSGWQPWAWGILAGILNTFSTISLYRSFEIGKMSVVAPVSASYPALTVILSMVTGERLTVARAAGIALTAAGVILVASGEKVPEDANESSTPERPAKKRLGIGWALGAALGFGVLFWLLGIRIVPRVGSTQAVWVIRLTIVALTALVISLMRKPLGLPRGRDNGWLLGIGLLDTGAFVLNNRGMLLEQVSVVSVLASLYGAVTVALAAIVLREHISKWQWCGIAAIFSGIYLISK
jgi:drug/metabolite transporter (DMT)-like permease